MHLVVFDIDGTLIHSHAQETDCFIQALSNVMGITDINKDIDSYEHVSDHGITNECVRRAFQRAATAEEQIAIEKEFINVFEKTLSLAPPTPIPGVRGLIEDLTAQKDIALAIATGCYLSSASLKFSHANLPFHHLPIGTSNDSPIRTNIMQTAHIRAKAAYDTDEFETITYVGDGPWDVRAVQTLRWNFIGITSNYSEETLKDLGATHIIPNYTCTRSFLNLLK